MRTEISRAASPAERQGRRGRAGSASQVSQLGRSTSPASIARTSSSTASGKPLLRRATSSTSSGGTRRPPSRPFISWPTAVSGKGPSCRYSAAGKISAKRTQAPEPRIPARRRPTDPKPATHDCRTPRADRSERGRVAVGHRPRRGPSPPPRARSPRASSGPDGPPQSDPNRPARPRRSHRHEHNRAAAPGPRADGPRDAGAAAGCRRRSIAGRRRSTPDHRPQPRAPEAIGNSQFFFFFFFFSNF